jgi:hypothetical protein
MALKKEGGHAWRKGSAGQGRGAGPGGMIMAVLKLFAGSGL